jgi:redox-sensitive bicupin YhaK (pirin superfamily)
MVELRSSSERGYTEKGWLKSYHSFSFADYVAPEHINFSALRVINDDVIDGGGAFDMHPHSDMEIITYMVSGSLRHLDDMCNGNLLKAGDVQRMTAGTGLMHSEVNADPNEPVHMLQIWIMPERNGLVPSYEEKHFTDEQKQNRWASIISNNPNDAAIKINQDMRMLASDLSTGQSLACDLDISRSHYFYIVRGIVKVDGKLLKSGDALLINEEQTLYFTAEENAEILWFDLP